MSLEDLIDSAMSTFGFDVRGRQTISFGPRALTLRLGPNNEILVEDDSGKIKKTLPKARKDDDSALVDAAKARVTTMKKQIKQIHVAQVQRLEAAMTTGRSWSVDAFRVRFLEHPLMHGLAQRLVFECSPAKGGRVRFIVSVEREVIDAELEALHLPDDGRVRITHPVEMTDAQRARWREVLDDFEIVQPFEQIGRRVFRKDDVPSEDRVLLEGLPMPTAVHFVRTLRKLGYELGGRGDGGLIADSRRAVGDHAFELHHSPLAPELLDVTAEVEVTAIEIFKNGKGVPWRRVSAALFSEVVRDLHLLMEA